MKNVVKKMAMSAVLACAIFASAKSYENQTVYIDMGKVFNEYHVTLKKNVEFKQKKAEAEASAQVKVKALQEKVNVAETLARAANVEQDAQKKKTYQEAVMDSKYKIAREKEELENYIRAANDRLTKEFANLRNELIEELQKSVNDFAVQNKVEAIVDISGRTTNNLSVYVYYNKEKDVTNDFLAVINKGHEEEVKKALEEQKEATSSDADAMKKLAEEAAKAINETEAK